MVDYWKTWTHSTKMGADKSAERISNGPKLICPSPKVWDFDEKRLHWASVVRVLNIPTILADLGRSAE